METKTVFMILVGLLILGALIYFDQRKKRGWSISSKLKKDWKNQKLLRSVGAILILGVIIFCLWKWWPDDKTLDTLFIPKTASTVSPVSPNYLIKDSSRVWTKGIEYTFNYDRTTYFTPDKPGKIHLYCWNQKSSWEMVTIRSDDGKVHDTLYNSTPERPIGIYSAKLMDDNPDSIAVKFSYTKE